MTLLRVFAFCFSLAYILFLPFWSRVFMHGTAFDPTFVTAFQTGEFDRLDLLCAALLATGLSLVFMALHHFRTRAGHVIIHRLGDFSVIAVMIIGLILTPFGLYLPDSIAAKLPDGSWVRPGLFLIVAGLCIFQFNLVTRLASTLVKVAFPVAIIIALNAVWGAIILTPPGVPYHSYADLGSTAEGTSAKHKVIWIIFDGLDQRLIAEDRPADVELPNFDELLATSFQATNARPPHAYTVISVPSMLLHRQVRAIGPLREDDLLIKLQNASDHVPLSQLPTVFSKAHAQGARIAAFGQIGFSYCRLFPQYLTKCWDRSGWWKGRADTIFSRAVKLIREGWRIFTRALAGRAVAHDFNVKHIDRLKSVIDDMSATVSRPDVDFVFAHLQLPHDPYVFNRHTDDFDPDADQTLGYLDNLELTDRALGAFIKSLKANNSWANTSLIVSADHWWRQSKKWDGKSSNRVPFIVRRAGQTRRYIHRDKIQTLATSALVLKLLNNQISSPADILTTMQDN